MIRASHRSLVLLLAASAVLSSGTVGAQPAPNDEQRCTGAVPVPPQAQADACTALIGSKRYRGQNLAILHSNRGVAYGKAGDHERAIADFDAAIRISPGHLRAHVNRGNAALARRDYERAIASFSQAIRLEPRNTQHLLSRADRLRQQGRHQERDRRL